MKSGEVKDIFVTGFNTPTWMSFLSFGNKEIMKNFGFNIAWRWQDSFIWESPLVTGDVSALSAIDAQLSIYFPKIKSRLKLGGSNILNHRYIQYAGGPTLGALYYSAITIDGL
jgi:hypothetical protein